METPNILLITIDSLRHDYESLLDTDTEVLSRVRKKLADPIEFSQAVANGSNTPSSFPSILTSTYPLMYGGYDYLDDRRPFLAATLQEASFETVAYHSNPHLGSNHNYDFGFGTFNDSAEGSDTVAGLKDRIEERLNPNSRLYSLLRRVWHLVSLSTDTGAYAKASTITDNAIDWHRNREHTDPFFMWLHYMDVHYPFTPPESCLTELGITPPSNRQIADLNGRMQEEPDSLTDEDIETLLQLYLGEIIFVDRQLNRLFDVLDDRDLLSNTAVFIAADHGEAFGEHGRFGHHPYMYDELVHVPMIASVPGYNGGTITDQVALADIGPTIYDLVDIETPAPVQGESFEPLLAGGNRENHTAICTAGGGSILATRTPKWKCLWGRDGKFELASGDTELYALNADPAEKTDVSDDNPEIVDRFVNQLETYVAEAERTDTNLPSIEEDNKTKQRLEDLGYL
jgi:arylsulfatase A-like enzyme